MKTSKQTFVNLKKNKRLNPTTYQKLKRNSIRGKIKGTLIDHVYQFTVQMKIFMHK